MAAQSRKKRSPIWDFFTVAEDTKFAQCNTCTLKVSRGGKSPKDYNTTNLKTHLKSHSSEYAKYEAKCQEDKSVSIPDQPVLKQLSLKESKERSQAWDINDARAQRVHRRIVDMIALDCQPFSVVEDLGFIRLLSELQPRYNLPSRKYLVTNILPQVYTTIESRVRSAICKVSFLTFTTDAWSSEGAVVSLLSLTAHWLTDKFERKSAVLHVQPIEGSHTGEHLAAIYIKMLEGWEIGRERLHLVIRDNAANMKKAMTDANFPSFGCFAHTLQLIVNDGILLQAGVVQLLAICRKIVGHFKHSTVAYQALHEIQERLSLPPHRLQQDVKTRWNSSLYMVKSIIEQKMALAAYAMEKEIPILTPTQIDLAEKIITVLTPIDEITNSISADASSISVVIPFLRMLTKTLEKEHHDEGVRQMKRGMLRSLCSRYDDVEDYEYLVLATLLDPRFKDKFFSGASARAKAREMLEDKLKERSTNTITESPAKRVRKEPPDSAIWQSFNEILEETGTTSLLQTGSLVDLYLAEPVIDYHQKNCYHWWSENAVRFPDIAKLAQQYLGAPPTSVPSERLFSGASDIYDEKRSRLLPDKAETLLFIKNNYTFLM